VVVSIEGMENVSAILNGAEVGATLLNIVILKWTSLYAICNDLDNKA
jgi:hypothetical protein